MTGTRAAWRMHRWLVLPVLLALGACAVGVDLQRPAPVKKSFVMDVTHPAPAAADAGAPTVVLGPVRMSPEYEQRAFVYRLDTQRYERDFYNQWFTSPRDQVARTVTEWLKAGGVFRDVVPPALAGAADYRLDLRVSGLHWDLRNAGRHVAEVEMQAYLSVRTDEGRVVAVQVRVDEREPVASSSPEDRVLALSLAMGRALTALERELAAAVSGRSGAGS
jgi:cholesterol transport system auxiliary component